jgi:pimeloyl-ACP methyl ester carboxylesterase
VRGQLWEGAGDLVLLVHDAGADLDAWRELPAELAADGYRVVALDLPGHGLSDDPWDADTFATELPALIGQMRDGRDDRTFLIGAGTIAPLLGAAAPDALVALSPQTGPDWSGERTGVPCLILTGSADGDRAAATDRYFRGRSGWTVVTGFGVPQQGTDLLATIWAGHAVEQMMAFLRDYRTPG